HEDASLKFQSPHPAMHCRKSMETKKTVRMVMGNDSKLVSALVCVALLGMNACSVGPNYRRPVVTVPTAYRGATTPSPSTPESAEPPANVPAPNIAASLGDEKWWEVFQDKELQGLIRTALQNNYDVR